MTIRCTPPLLIPEEAIIESKAFLILLLPVIALAMMLGWGLLITRGGRPLTLRIQGFGVSIQLDNTHHNRRASDRTKEEVTKAKE